MGPRPFSYPRNGSVKEAVDPSRENIPFYSFSGEILKVLGEDQRVWGKLLAKRREGRRAAGACQDTCQPALAHQQHTVSSISHSTELILHQNLVFCKFWAWIQRVRITHTPGWSCGTSTGAYGEISFHFCLKEGRLTGTIRIYFVPVSE